jgi:hypothetical protein
MQNFFFPLRTERCKTSFFRSERKDAKLPSKYRNKCVRRTNTFLNFFELSNNKKNQLIQRLTKTDSPTEQYRPIDSTDQSTAQTNRQHRPIDTAQTNRQNRPIDRTDQSKEQTNRHSTDQSTAQNHLTRTDCWRNGTDVLTKF